MASHSSARTRQQTPHGNQTTRTATVIDALKRRAQAVLNDESLDPQSRAILRYSLEINDPWLAELVRRADAGESIITANESLSEAGGSSSDKTEFSQSPTNNDLDSVETKIEALADMICCSDEVGVRSGAFLVLMATLENATHPKALANVAKHFAFTRCGELNLYGMVEAQVAELEAELLA